MEDNKFDFTKRPDLSKLNNPKVENKPVSLQVKSVEDEAPKLVVDEEKNKWVVKLLIVLICFVLVGTGLYFVLPSATSPIDINIDFQLDSESVELIDIGASGEEPLTRKLMPGDPFEIKYNISALDDDQIEDEEVFVRVKYYAMCDEIAYNNIISIDTSHSGWLENWTVGADGYLYSNAVLAENQTLEVSNRLMINTSVGNEFQGKTIQICILAECLQAGQNGYQAIESEWETAPLLWKQNWKDITR